MSTSRQATGSAEGTASRPARRRPERRPPTIVVDEDLCKSCAICIKLCPKDVFDRDEQGRPVAARPELCTLCRFCEIHCPDLALEVLAAPTAEAEAADDEAAVAPATAKSAARRPAPPSIPEDEGDG